MRAACAGKGQNMKSRVLRNWLPAAALFALGAAGLSLQAPPSRSAAQKKPVPAPAGVFLPDKGKFKVFAKGQPVASEEFELSPAGGSWVARGSVEIKAPNAAPVHVSATMRLQPDGAPQAYEWTSQAEKKNGAHILFEKGVARITLEMQGARPFEQDITFGTPKIAILDNNLYHHYAVLARVYDWSKGGVQTFPVLIPQDLTPGSITVESTGSQAAEGKSYEGLRVSTADLEVLLFLDADHRLMRLEVPAAKVSVVRE
jgi:hypothetical protein